MASSLTLTSAQAEHIVRAHLPGHAQSTVRLLTEIKNKNTAYSYTSSTRTYIADISAYPPRPKPAPCSCFITIAPVSQSESESTPSQYQYHTNSLPTTHRLIALILAHTSIPLPPPILDTSLLHAPYHVLLSPAAPLASTSVCSLREARRRGLVDEQDLVRVEMQIGAFLGQMHSGVLGEWFGLPRPEERKLASTTALGMDGPDPSRYPSESYSWQETFAHLLETLLSEFELQSPLALDLPYEDIRRYLSRAIASFLFDDVEVPSLVWMTGSEDDVYVFVPPDPPPSASTASSLPSSASLPSGKAEAQATQPTSAIAAILPNIAHALWGDPLLESFFSFSPSLSSLSLSASSISISAPSPLSAATSPSPSHNPSPGPSPALLEAYLASGGTPPIVFPRHKTKRLWYDLFLGLVVLRERGAGLGGEAGAGLGAREVGEREKGGVNIDREWAVELVRTSVDALRDAPCY